MCRGDASTVKLGTWCDRGWSHQRFPALPGQVLNQTSRIELQLQENSLSTTQLEKQLLLQTNEIHKLQNRNK